MLRTGQAIVMSVFSNVHDIPNDNIISERHGHNRPGGVCISRDFGASWKHEAQGISPRPVTSIVLDPKSPKDARTLYAGFFRLRYSTSPSFFAKATKEPAT